MGPGHLGLGFAAKPAAKKVPLWLLLIATELLDVLGFIFEAFGIERFVVSQLDLKQGLQILTPGYIPWSHSLFMSIVWSLLAGWIAYRFYKDSRTGAVVGSLVLSHWVLDFLVHPPRFATGFQSVSFDRAWFMDIESGVHCQPDHRGDPPRWWNCAVLILSKTEERQPRHNRCHPR